jgi:F-type H+-transporting ATPase subunit delta
MDAVLEAKVLAKIASLSDKKITIENPWTLIVGFILKWSDKQFVRYDNNRLQVLKRLSN